MTYSLNVTCLLLLEKNSCSDNWIIKLFDKNETKIHDMSYRKWLEPVRPHVRRSVSVIWGCRVLSTTGGSFVVRLIQLIQVIQVIQLIQMIQQCRLYSGVIKRLWLQNGCALVPDGSQCLAQLAHLSSHIRRSIQNFPK